jgi:hypothetical protein
MEKKMDSPEDFPADIIAKAWEVVRYHTCITEGDICKFQDGCGCANDIARALMERDRAATERAANIVESFAWLERRAEIHGETALDIDIIAAAIRSQP